MKAFFHNILSIALASLVFFTTMSFTVDMHYCGKDLVDFSLVHVAQTCGMEKQQSAEGCANDISQKSCCSDKQIIVEGQNDLKISFDKLTFEQQAFVATFFYTYSNLFEGLKENVTSYGDYAPPLVIRQIYKLDETYLI